MILYEVIIALTLYYANYIIYMYVLYLNGILYCMY